MATRTRQGRLQHPGVTVARKKRGDRVLFEGRYTDPDTGERVHVWLAKDAPGLRIKTEKAARQWAVAKSREIAARRDEIAAGGSRYQRITLDACILRYIRYLRGLGRTETTTKRAEAALREWRGWLHERGVTDLLSVRAKHVADWHLDLLSSKALVGKVVEGERVYVPGDEERNARTINKIMTTVGAMVRWAIPQGYSMLEDAVVARLLRKKDEPERKPVILDQDGVRELLIALLRHDAATYKITRAEHREAPSATAVNATQRHPPAAAFFTFMLLSGLRAGEQRSLRWDDAHEADLMPGTGSQHRRLGWVLLQASGSKSRRSRKITLAETPTARDILRALRARRGTDELVFPAWSKTVITQTTRRLRTAYGAPETFSSQTLRATCATVLNAPSNIYKSAALAIETKRLGHSPDIALEFYVDRLAVNEDAETFEDALGLRPLFEAIAASVVTGAQQQLDALEVAGEVGDVRPLQRKPAKQPRSAQAG